MSIKFIFFFFNDTATTEIYTLSLHDALPIFEQHGPRQGLSQLRAADPVLAHDVDDALDPEVDEAHRGLGEVVDHGDRKSTRLNSSHSQISYAVFCLKKKK